MAAGRDRGWNKAGILSYYNDGYNPGYRADPLWQSFPWLAYGHDPDLAVLYDERWTNYNATATTGDWVGTAATAGSAAISTAASGVIEVDCNSTTQGQGFQIQRTKTAFVPVASKDLWFEACFKVVDTYDKVQLFVGLAEADTSIIASGAISTSNHLGFLISTGGAGAMVFAANKATAATTKTFTTIEEATYVRAGFKISGSTLVGAAYLNGTEVTGAAITATNIPVVALYPSIVCQTDDTNDPILHCKWMRVGQLR